MKHLLLSFMLLPFSAFSSADTLNVCLTGSTEKALPKYGEAFVNGVSLAMEELPAADRERVKLSLHYYESNPLAPLSKLEDMRKDSCDAIIGFSTGNDLLTVENALEENPIFTLSIYGDPQERFEKSSCLRTMQPSASDLTQHLFSHLPFKLKPQNKFLMITASDRSEMTAYKNAYLQKLRAMKITPDQVDVMEQTHDISAFKELLSKKGQWDYVIILTRSLIAAEITDLLSHSSKPIILGTKYFGSADLPAYLNYLKSKKVEAYFSRQNCTCDKTPEFVKVKEAYKEKYKIEPMSISMDGYDAAKFILLSLKDKVLTPERVLKSLKTSDFKGISSLKVGQGLKVNSDRRFLIRVNEDGYKAL